MVGTTFASLVDTIRSRFYAQITQGGDGGPSVVTVFGNMPPVDGSGNVVAQPDTGTWVLVGIHVGEVGQVSMLAPQATERRVGTLTAKVYVDHQSGEAAAWALVDRIATAFRRQTLDGVVYETPSLGTIGREGGWWTVTVRCPFQSDVMI